MRSSMAIWGVLLMSSCAAVMLWLGYAGYGALPVIAVWAAAAVGGLVVMATMVRLGITAAWREPGLALPQIMWAITASAIAYVLAGEGKGAVPGLLAVTLLFAALHLRAKQIVAVSLYALGVFSFAVLLAADLGHGAQPELEIGYAAVLLVVLKGGILFSLRLYQLRVSLRKQRQALALALEENRELASRDPLTGLLNRRYMLEFLQLEQRRCLRGGHSMTLAVLDIDHFKSINDRYGHGVGDAALQAFATQVQAHIRSSDVFSRWGGEEFVLLLTDTQVDGAMLTLQRVCKAVQNTVLTEGPVDLRMTVSIGFAEHIAGEPIELTLDRADKALYSAKRAGRNQVVQGTCMPAMQPASSVSEKQPAEFV